MLLEIEGLRGGYGKKDICRGISCELDRGQVLSVLGPNGCGKTTFFRLLLGFLAPSGGEIRIDGVSALEMSKRELAKLIAYIPQHHTPIFSYTVLEIIIMGRASHFSAFDKPRETDRAKAFAAMEMLKILPLANQKYTALSGGQRQMVLIARALCQEAKILVMDEPGASLDYANNQLVMDVVAELARRGYGIIMSTHSPEQPFSAADRVLLLKEGKTAAFGPPEEAITGETLEQVYGIEMDVVSICDRYRRKHTLCIPVKQQTEAGEEKDGLQEI